MARATTKTTTTTTTKPAVRASKADNGNNGNNGNSGGSTRKSGWRKVTDEERHQMIQFAAYMKAQNRGFQAGDSFQDWINAEREVDAWLKTQHQASQS